MIKKFSFLEAEPLLAFIEDNREKIVGKTIKNFYMNGCYGFLSDNPLVFELDDYVLVLEYLCPSNMTVYIVEPEQFYADESLSFLYEDLPEDKKERWCVENTMIPALGEKIAAIEVERHSEQFEIRPWDGETRPAGGDYFKTITVRMENGEAFYICGDPYGYEEIWDDYNCTDPHKRKDRGYRRKVERIF